METVADRDMSTISYLGGGGSSLKFELLVDIWLAGGTLSLCAIRWRELTFCLCFAGVDARVAWSVGSFTFFLVRPFSIKLNWPNRGASLLGTLVNSPAKACVRYLRTSFIPNLGSGL